MVPRGYSGTEQFYLPISKEKKKKKLVVKICVGKPLLFPESTIQKINKHNTGRFLII